MRCAIYFVPPRGESLCATAASWLRRDPYTGAGVSADVKGLTQQDHALVTAIPRRYGFHATMKPPFDLAPGCTIDLLGHRLGAFAKGLVPFTFDVEIALFQNAYAFVPKRSVPHLDELAARIVAEFDHFRVPITADEVERRNVAELSERQLSHLMSWGDPYVFDQFRFHMALTGPIPTRERPGVERALRAHFGSAPRGLALSQLVVAAEPAERAPFLVYSVHPFATVPALMTA